MGQTNKCLDKFSVFSFSRFAIRQCPTSTGPSLGQNESTNFPGSTFEISRFPILDICFFLIFPVPRGDHLTAREAATGPSLRENESTNFPGSTFEISRFSILDICLLAKYVWEICW